MTGSSRTAEVCLWRRLAAMLLLDGAVLSSGVCRPVLSAIAFGLVVAAGWCASAQAVFPGANGRIAFTASVSGVDPLDPSFSWIVSIRPDGEDARVLAGVKARGPAYRPDGHMIAFSRFREIRRGGELGSRSRGIYLMPRTAAPSIA